MSEAKREKKPNTDPVQTSFFYLEPVEEVENAQSVALPLEIGPRFDKNAGQERPELPARWEAVQLLAERRQVLPVVLSKLRPVPAIDYLKYLLALASDEGYTWVVHGDSGSGKSTFFHTLEHQTNNEVRTHIIDGRNVQLSDQSQFSRYLTNIITRHKEANGEQIPLVIILEERENEMNTEERSAIVQALRNTLRPPGPGKNVVFVLPVTNPTVGTLFLDQAKSTGVPTPLGPNSIFAFQGPQHTEHVDIVCDLFVTLYDRDISDFGLQRSQLQAHVASHQTIGQYMRIIREELTRQNQKYINTVKSYHYKPFTVIVCFVNPLPAFRTEPIIKGMTINAFGRIRTGELLRTTQSQKALKWQGRERALANIVEALDLRIVEIAPQIITKLIYGYGWQPLKADGQLLSMVDEYLAADGIDYNTPKSLRQNLRQQLAATNLFKIIIGEQTTSYSTPRYIGSNTPTKQEQERQAKETAELAVTKFACERSAKNQYQFHKMFEQALDDLLENSHHVASVANYTGVYAEPSITTTGANGEQQKPIKPDVVIDMQDKLFFLEFCWRSEEHFTYGDVANYVLRKINESYLNLPLIRALQEG